MPSENMEMKADIRQIRDDVTKLQIGVARIDDLVSRLDKIESSQSKAAADLAAIVSRSSTHGKLIEKWMPWVIAVLASGGLVSSEMLGVARTVAIETPVVVAPAE